MKDNIMVATLKSAKTLRAGEVNLAASFIGAFFECSPAVQDVVREMIAIIEDDEASFEDKDAAANTLYEALFPLRTADFCDMEEGAYKSPSFLQAGEDLEAEHEAFSDRVRALMEKNNVTQEALANAAGISQPAVSNILTRKSRPQRRTVAKFAAALGVAPEELWPEYESATVD